MADNESAKIEFFYDTLTSKEIVNAISSSPLLPSFHVLARLKRDKRQLIERLVADSPHWTDALTSAAENKIQPGRSTRQGRRVKQRERQQSERVARNTQAVDEFLDLPTEEELVGCYQAFYDATSTAALRSFVCGVCARSLNERTEKASTIPLSELPGRKRLRPAAHHDAQILTEGYLLERSGCKLEGDKWSVHICRQCLNSLSKKSETTPPKYSLANGLWLGEVPWELRHLTITEQLLIARVYPRVFVVKLFPKAGSQGLETDQLQSAMRGNVTTFELNSDAIADMIAGKLMPQPPAVLASVLSVTFIGRGRIINPAALRLFHVRRHMLAAALKWLKANNPKYYGDIDIDDSRLALLPEDDVPPEVLANIHHEPDATVADVESSGYVPPEDIDGPDAESEQATSALDPTEQNTNDPDVVPLQFLGVMDNDMTKLPARELMQWGLQNLQQQNEEGGYAVRHGQPVSTFGQPPAGGPAPDPDRPNYWERAFPLLYPYGLGGIEADRQVPLSFIEHVQWSLRYHDRRFRIHPTFCFVACSIYQRRQTLASARVQMRRHDFDSVARTLSMITPEDLRRAAVEEERGQPHSNNAIRILKRHINTTSSRVIGSDAARFQFRNQIWSTSVYLNPPTLWITINPDDLHDPIAQLFAGEDIDMDNFIRTAGPDKLRRSQNIARDPLAAAEFFHFLIDAILKHLFGVEATPYRIHSRPGVLGRVQAYFGVVECQGRGTLHLHSLLWLKGAPSPDRLKDLLRSDEFRTKVITYLKSNVRSYQPELATPAQLAAIPSDPEIAYSRLPDPSLPRDEFLSALAKLETLVVRTKQYHVCVFGRCLRWNKTGQLVCKRHAPWDLSEFDVVETDGTVRTKRSLGNLNGYCPAISVVVKCNNDIKILLHGTGTNNITFYITSYIAKKQGRSHNASSLLAEHLLYHFVDTTYINNIREQQRQLIFRAVNVLNREQEMAAPLAVSYLMGWNDVYRSHHYATIFWGSFVSQIVNTYPTLRQQDHEEAPRNPEQQDSIADQLVEVENGLSVSTPAVEPGPEQIILEFDHRSTLRPRSSQVEDYIHRGEELNSYSVLDYFVGTYEKPLPRQPQTKPNISTQPTFDDDSSSHSDQDTNSSTNLGAPAHRRGRPSHKRVRYLTSHPRYETHTRVIRPDGHNTLPNFLGPRFPHGANPDQADIFAASALTLLKPWRSLIELKDPAQSWRDALEQFLSTSSQHTRDIVSSMQHYHTCKLAAEEKSSRVLEVVQTVGDNELGDDMDMGIQEDSEPSNAPRILTNADITPAKIEKARVDAEDKRDVAHGCEAVAIGRTKGVFTAPPMPIQLSATRATPQNLEVLKGWQDLLQKSLLAPAVPAPAGAASNDSGSVLQLDLSSNALTRGADPGDVIPRDQIVEDSIHAADYNELFTEQRRAFDIVRWHLDKTMDSAKRLVPPPPQLLMLLMGEGGTGKSKVIQTITKEFECRGLSHFLLKSAYTGIAASLINGKTTHNVGCISVNGNDLSDSGKQKLAQIWKDVQYLILDECSMISKAFLGQLSRHVTIGKLATDSPGSRSAHIPGSEQPRDGPTTTPKAERPFGGVNVILCGDFHQFPPVAGGAKSALYHPNHRGPLPDSDDASNGRKAYEQFTTVVILRRQVRVSDPIWRDFLRCLRVGQLKPEHEDMLNQLVLTNPRCLPTNFQSDAWKDVSLVTPRNAVRNRWNDAAVMRHCQRSGNQLFHCPASDTIKGKPLSLVEQYLAVTSSSGSDAAKGQNTKNRLPDSVPLALGMSVMVTLNVETDLDLANGARGTIVGIYLHPEEPEIDATAPVVTLKCMPVCILVQMARTRAITLPGLKPGVLPIVPASKAFQIVTTVRQRNGELVKVRKTVRRKQFPITPAYAFTDYRSQGQTIKSVIVDIAKPPSGRGLNLFNIYVALSRSSGRDSIRLLRDFDHAALLQPLDDDLAVEDERLEDADKKTKAWWEMITHGDSSIDVPIPM